MLCTHEEIENEVEILDVSDELVTLLFTCRSCGVEGKCVVSILDVEWEEEEEEEEESWAEVEEED